MALTKGQKTGAAIAAGVLAVALFMGAANASDDVPEDEPDDGPPPPPPPPEEKPDVVFPPLGNVCNYSGCGPLFDSKHSTPTAYCLAVQQLGYPIDCAAVAANSGTIAVDPQRAWVWKFQDEYNKLRASVALAGPVTAAGNDAMAALNAIREASSLARDGLIGERTIDALIRARSLQNRTGIAWRNLVKLAV